VTPATFASNQIAYVNWLLDEGKGVLYLGRADGSQTFELAEIDQWQTAGLPAWAPDGLRIAHVSDGALTVSPLNGVAFQLTENNSRAGFPRWSPDGQTLLFTMPLTPEDKIQISVISATSDQAPTPLAIADAAAGVPVWSPDGTRIAYVADGAIVVIYADGSNPITLVTGDPAQPSDLSWSPDGRHLAYIAGQEGKTGLHVVDTTGRNLVVIMDDSIPDDETSVPIWSPDGQRIAFVAKRDGDEEIYVANADGSQVTNLTNAPGAQDNQPTWSPDGQHIAFSSDRAPATGYAVYQMKADGSEQARLFPAAGSYFQVGATPLWSPK
jgi:TolB protein